MAGAVCLAPSMGTKGRSSFGRFPVWKRSHSADPSAVMHDSRPLRSRKPTVLIRSSSPSKTPATA